MSTMDKRTDAVILDALAAIRAEQAAQRALLLHIIGTLADPARDPRDRHDAALRQLLPSATEGLPFSAGQLLVRQGHHPALRAALLAVDLVTTADVGTWLRDHKGCKENVSIERRGRMWLALHVDTYVQPIEPAV